MMAVQPFDDRLIDRLPAVRGRLTENAPLAGTTWFRVGGPAEVMFRPADPADLAAFLAEKPDDVPVTVIGVGSNTLVRDGGVPGVVVRLTRDFARIEVDDESSTVRAGAAALDANVAAACRNASVAGLEYLSGIPGSIGGAIRMNAGAYGTETKDVVVSVEALDPSGTTHRLGVAELGFGYRHCSVAEDWIFLSAVLQGTPGDTLAIARRMAEIRASREDSQPLRSRTGGSTFANPERDGGSGKAWQLIDQAGCRGLAIGGAAMSEKHANFMINTGTATAAELEALGEEVRRRVKETSGVALRWEIRRIGVPAPSDGGARP